MLKDSDYVFAGSRETFSNSLPIGVKIFIAAGRELTELEKGLIYNHIDDIHNIILKGHMLQDKEEMERAVKVKEAILGLFGERKIFVKEVPNGYCRGACCEHLPWFLVTTNIGPVRIGWRKRVINIDWSETNQKKTADELFPNEDVTKYEHAIHAWGYDKAKEYLEKIHE